MDLVNDVRMKRRNTFVFVYLECKVYFQTPAVMVTDSDILEDHRKVDYSLYGQGSSEFEIEPATGVLRVKDYRRIDCEEICEYNLTVSHWTFSLIS